jgi:competence protein ComEC
MGPRLLLPSLAGVVTGILIDHYLLPRFTLPFYIIPIIILISTGSIFAIPFSFRNYLFLLIFLLLGINSAHHKSTLSKLPPEATMKNEVIIEGTVYRPPNVRWNIATVFVHGEKLFFSNEYKIIKTNLVLRVYTYRGGLKVGDRIRFPAIFREFKNFNNPGGFDYKFYMENLGVSFMATTRNAHYIVPMGKGNLGTIERALEKIRAPIRNFFHERLPPYSRAIYRALILGERQEITKEIRTPFDRVGIGHIMAVSGLHLGLVAWFSFKLIKWLLSLSYRLTLMADIKKIAAVVTIFPVITYGLITGFHVSAQRATIMVIVFLWSLIIDREKDVWSSLSLAAIAVLSLDGNALFTASFQLSFITVAGILYLAPLILSWISKIKDNDGPIARGKRCNFVSSYGAGLIAVTVSATIVTIPIISYYFNRVSVIALLGNLTVVPIIGLWVLPLGLISSVILFLSDTIAWAILYLSELGLKISTYLVDFWSDIPWGSMKVVQPNIFEIFLFYTLIFLSIHSVRSRLFKILFVSFLIISSADIGYWVYQTRYNKNLELTVLDMDKGNAIFVKYPGSKKMLIAFNVFSNKGIDQGRNIIFPYLCQKKVLGIDYLFLPNYNKQFTDRMRFIVHTFHPDQIICDLQKKMVVGGVAVSRHNDSGIILEFKGWYALLNEHEVEIKKKKMKNNGEVLLSHVVIKKEKIGEDSFGNIVNLTKTGALTININPKGNLKIRSFLKTKRI